MGLADLSNLNDTALYYDIFNISRRHSTFYQLGEQPSHQFLQKQ